MAAKLLSGKEISESILAELRAEIEDIREVHGIAPCLAVVRVGDDPASSVYVRNKVKTSIELGIESVEHSLQATIDETELLELVEQLNDNSDIDGILVQLPLPDQISENSVLEAIDPEKDVDGFHPINVGRLSQGRRSLVPCTPAGVIEILKRSGIEIGGREAVIVGRSNIVGKPMAMLLLQENATVTICHSKTTDLASHTKRADILVSAIGRAGVIGSEHIKEGATVIDVGINKFDDETRAEEFFDEAEIEKRLAAIKKRGFTLVGDVKSKDAIKMAGAFTPVPGGVGLLTIAMLMRNTIEAAKRRRRII